MIIYVPNHHRTNLSSPTEQLFLCPKMGPTWVVLVSLLLPLSIIATPPPPPAVCIVGSGIGGSSVAHFLRAYSPPDTPIRVVVIERNPIVGGRMATVSIAGDTFEAGASILHPKNYHASNFTHLLGLKRRAPSVGGGFSLGIWNGDRFLFKTLAVDSNLPFVQKIVDLANSAFMWLRYGSSLFRMQHFVQDTVNCFLKYYSDRDTRPIFNTVDDMLKWAALYNLTTRTLDEQLVGIGLSPLLIQELVTVITRINYGQSVHISGLAGAVSLAGSGGGLWAVEGGNWQIVSGLINKSDVELHLNVEVDSISYLGEYYELHSTRGQSFICNVTVVAAPLDELNIQFTPPVSVPERKMQHTHATFVRGLINPEYFGLKVGSEVPELVGTTEDPNLPFSSISVLKRHSEIDMTYKVFSRNAMPDALLDTIFSERKETIKIDWAAYPHYNAPELFAPFILDGRHLYYVNAFENAASTMETSSVAAENVARLILSRFFGKSLDSSDSVASREDGEVSHSDL